MIICVFQCTNEGKTLYDLNPATTLQFQLGWMIYNFCSEDNCLDSDDSWNKEGLSIPWCMVWVRYGCKGGENL